MANKYPGRLQNVPDGRILDAEIILLRRVMGSALTLSRNLKSPRTIETYWVLLEVVSASLAGDEVTQKQLVAHAHGVWSQATISRSISDLQAISYISASDNSIDRRSPILSATVLGQNFVESRAKITRALLEGAVSECGEATQ
jgi:hypothetical protein